MEIFILAVAQLLVTKQNPVATTVSQWMILVLTEHPLTTKHQLPAPTCPVRFGYPKMQDDAEAVGSRCGPHQEQEFLLGRRRRKMMGLRLVLPNRFDKCTAKTKQKGLEAKASQILNGWRGKPMNLRAPTWRHTQRWTSPSYSCERTTVTPLQHWRKYITWALKSFWGFAWIPLFASRHATYGGPASSSHMTAMRLPTWTLHTNPYGAYRPDSGNPQNCMKLPHAGKLWFDVSQIT